MTEIPKNCLFTDIDSVNPTYRVKGFCNARSLRYQSYTCCNNAACDLIGQNKINIVKRILQDAEAAPDNNRANGINDALTFPK